MERAAGNTKWNLKSLFAYAFDGILSFSTAPLKLPGILGVLLFLVSCCLGISLLAGSLVSHQAADNLTLILTVVIFLSSLQMMMVFILGEYLSKDYLENKKRPIYIIRESYQGKMP